MMAGGDALARGISSGVGNLSRALEDIGKKKKAEASLANVLRKKHSLTQPDRKDEFATMSLDELRGEDEAFTVQNVLAREEQAAAQRQQQIDLMLRKAAMDQAQAQAGAMAMSRLGEMGQDPNSIPAPFGDAEFDRRTRQPSLSDVMSELGNAGMATGGGMDPRAALDLSQAIANQSKGQGMMGPLAFEEDPTTGARFARGGNTILPSGTNPAKIATVTVTDPNTGEDVELPVNPRTGQPMLKPRPPQNAPRVAPDFTKSLGELAIGLDDPKNGPKVLSGIKTMIDSAHTLKQIDKDQRDALYEQFGIGSGGRPSAQAPAAAGDAELKLAQEALAKGVDRKKVAAKYKQRTGKDLPQ